MSPGHILRPSPLLRQTAGRPGTWEAEVGMHWSNLWNYDEDRYRLDGEWLRAEVRVQRALDDEVTIGFEIPMMQRSGGCGDGFIDEFHSLMGLGSAGRESFARDRSSIEVGSPGHERTLLEGNSGGLGDASAFFVWQLPNPDPSRPAVALQTQFVIPTGDAEALRGLGQLAVAQGVMASKRLGTSSWLVFGGAGIFYSFAEEMLGARVHTKEYSALLGLTWECSRSCSIVIQNLSTGPIGRDDNAFSQPTHELTTGLRWRCGPATTLDFGLTENLLIYKNSADLAAHLSVARRF